MADWDKYPNFTKEEFDCQETGMNDMRDSFLSLLQLPVAASAAAR